MHTRISEDLDAALRRAAEDLRLPVSNLVRNVLEDAFIVMETVSESVGELVDDVMQEARHLRHRFREDWRDRARDVLREARERGRHARQGTGAADPEPTPEAPEETHSSDTPAEFPGVVGWQPLVMNLARDCAGCGRALARGDRARMGISEGRDPIVFLCERCAQDLA